MLCDAHIHYIPPQISGHTSFYKGVWQDKARLYDFLDQDNVGKSLLVYPSTDAHISMGGMDKVCALYNAAVENISRENSKIIPAAIVNIDSRGCFSSQIAELKSRGFRALSLSSSFGGSFNMEKLFPFFAAVEKNNLAVFIHPQTTNPIGFERVKDPLLMPVLEYSLDISMCLGLFMTHGVLDKFNIKFIFSSLGGVVSFLKERFDRVYAMLRSRNLTGDLGCLPSEILRRVYVDTSGATAKNIEIAIDLFGEDKILWGSDYPVNPVVLENMAMLESLGGNIKQKITSDNFLAIFK